MKRISAFIISAVMILSLLPTSVLADKTKADNEIIIAQQSAQDVPEWARDDGTVFPKASLHAAASKRLPERFNMRDYGWVTPVKQQNPWGSCWAFGSIAAAETSMISSGLVESDDPLDLSEHHLVWNVFKPITEREDARQAGEGLYTFNKKVNAPFNTGGGSVMASALFASGSGPIEEVYFPYWGKNKWLSTIYPHEEAEAYVEGMASMLNKSVEEILFMHKKIIASWEGRDPESVTNDEAYAYIELTMAHAETYSRVDDWSLPETFDDNQSTRLINEGWVLKNANTFPSYWTDGDRNDLSQDEVHAMKQELMNGRGIAVAYYTDQSGNKVASAEYKTDGTYGDHVYGGVNYAQYVDQPMPTNHTVCIIGWDDNFKKENFNEGSQPPADGAWIVKNSWGSETDAGPDANGNIVNRAEYGAYNAEGKTTGLFYLSYYDKTLGFSMETFEFSSNLDGRDVFYVSQYDYMPASSEYYTKSQDTQMSTANVFTAEEDADLASISTRTCSDNTRVTYAIIRLNDNAELPDDGTILYKRTVNLANCGYHRIDLDNPVRFHKGERFAVAITGAVVEDDGNLSYEISTSRALSEDASIAYGSRYYAKSVINEGESFLYYSKDGTAPTWHDWSIIAPEEVETQRPLVEGYDVCLDNFSIKAYLLPAEVVPEEERPINITEPVFTGIKDQTFTGKPISQKFTVSLEGAVLTEGTDYSVKYAGNTEVGTAKIIVTGQGKYTGSVTRSFKINPKGTSLKKLTAASKGFTAKWAKQTSQTTGYQIQYSTKKDFSAGQKTKTVNANKTVSKKITGLKSKKKYYVRIRTYKTVSGKKYYSSWSAGKSVKTR